MLISIIFIIFVGYTIEIKNIIIMDSIVLIPTYNEKENIEAIIRKVFSLPKVFHILVIDDNSADGTASIVKQLMQEFPDKLHILERSGKLGLGTAYIAGFKWSLEHNYEYIFEMDADFSHNPEDLLRLYSACADNGADMAIGSRYVNGVVNVVNWPMGRVLLSYYASKYVKFVTGMPLGDSTAGFVCYRKKTLETINLDKIKFVGYAFQIEMKYTAYRLGFKLKEVSIIFTDRALGQSKMSKKIIKEAFLGVFQLRFRKYEKSKNSSI
ncbi:dolichol-phosphate mannosyltransferase [Bacteroidia bacterium]|nr:dolichol-phosphate mannosyltransferase [Bacteroidia bacterium]